MDDRTAQLEHGNIEKLLITFALPAIIATTATSLYNIIDRIFIGNGVSDMALAGVGLSLPIMNLASAFGTLVGAGASAIVSIRMGEKKHAEATQILCNALIINIIISVIFSIATLSFLTPLLQLFGADHSTLPYARDFLQIILFGNIITQIFFSLNSIMRASGYPLKAMLSILITVACNTILAPIFIFKFQWGIRGAATATIISQLIGMCWVLAHFIRKKSYIHFEKSGMHIDFALLNDIFAIGLSPFFIHVCTSIVVIFMNWRLKEYGGNTAIASYGIVASIQSLVITMVLGLTHGMQPIVGYNYGAGQHERVMKTYRQTLGWAVAICGIAFAAVELFPGQIANAFTDSDAMNNSTSHALRICFLMIIITGFQVVTSNFFQSIGKAKISILLSLSRQVIFLIPFIWLLPRVWNLDGAWLATPAADICAGVVTALLLWNWRKKTSTSTKQKGN